MTTHAHIAEVSDAAALIVAAATGDQEAVDLVLSQLARNLDTRGAILLLSHSLYLAGTAVRKEMERAAEGDTGVPSLEFLIAASREAGRRAQG